MNTKNLFIALCMLYSLTPYSQEGLRGKVICQSTNEPLSFVNIGVVGKNIGTVSNLNGEFTIDIPDAYNSDTLKFSMIGFKSQSHKVQEFKKKFINSKKLIVSLEENVTALSEVVIVGKKRWKVKTLGNVNESTKTTSGFYSKELGAEIGTIIKIKKSPTYIESFSFFVAKNTYGNLFFRFNIYNLKDDKPFENILNENIFVQTGIGKGKVTVDLKKYNISVEDDFFISLEYVKPLPEKRGNELSFGSGLGLLDNPSYSRFSSQGDWEKVPLVGIGLNVDVKYEK